MQRKLIIFDFDGTLADTFLCFVQAFDAAADKYGFQRLDRDSRELLRRLDAHQIMAHHQIPFWKVPAIARHMRSAIERDIAGIALFPGIAAALRALAERGAVLAIVTSNSRANVQQVLGPENAALFSHCQYGASLFGKPAKLRKVLLQSGIGADAAILVGDEIRDARAAAEVGMAFGAVGWGFNHIDALRAQGAAELFSHADELAQKLG